LAVAVVALETLEHLAEVVEQVATPQVGLTLPRL
jgi:hypothetical protein